MKNIVFLRNKRNEVSDAKDDVKLPGIVIKINFKSSKVHGFI